VLRVVALPALLIALGPFDSSVRPLPQPMKTQLKQGGFWRSGCPVGLSGLRLLTVTHRGFDGRAHTGQLVVNRRRAARPLAASFECRQAVPSPCTGGKGTGTWSMHAYGLAVDLNPRENPYVGCGQSRDPDARSYRDRSDRRPGMIGSRTVRAFEAIGWSWAGAWAGDTKDYMHFSSNGH